MKTISNQITIFCIAVVAFCLPITIASGQVIQSESFDGTPFPPTGWENAGFGSLWVQRMNGTFPTCLPHSGAAMARFSARNQIPGTQEVFISPVVDFSGNTGGATPTFTLWVYRDGSSTAGDSVTILVNDTNALAGATRIGAVARSRFFILPVNELADGWYEYTFNAPSTLNTDTNYFMLNGTSLDGANIYIDDVSWIAYPELCSGAPVAGTISADPAVICGGPDVTELTLTGATMNYSGLSYHWQYSLTGSAPWTDFGTSETVVTSDTLSVDTYFRCYIECSASGLSDTAATFLVTVSSGPLPVITVDPGNILNYCSGYPPLVIVVGGAATYTWTPDIAIPNGVGDSALAAPFANTNYTIVGTDSPGCTAIANITVNVRQTPNVNSFTNNDTICEGLSTILQAFVTGPGMGIQYEWNPGALNGNNVTVSPIISTSYVVSATSPQGCVGYDTLDITVIPAPVVAFSFNIVSQVVTFTDNSTGAITWSWDFGDGDTSDIQNPVHYYAALGTYTVTLTISDGVCSNTITQTVVITTIGLESIDATMGLMLFPNPAIDNLTVEFEAKAQSIQMELINAIGQVLEKSTIYAIDGNRFRNVVDLRSYAPGIYTIKISSADDVSIRQFVIK